MQANHCKFREPANRSAAKFQLTKIEIGRTIVACKIIFFVFKLISEIDFEQVHDCSKFRSIEEELQKRSEKK